MKVKILPRFCGPKDSGNGGYCCGLLAKHIHGPACVRLLQPPPVGTELTISVAGDEWLLSHDNKPVASARSAQIDRNLVPAPPTLAQARLGRTTYDGFKNHAYPGCFVCGPERAPGDGLCLFSGPLDDSLLVACDWLPDKSLLDEKGLVKPEFVWSALDCPGFFALREPLLEDNRFLLGQMTAEILQTVPAGAPLIVYAWKSHSEGRKYFSGSAICNESGSLLAHSRQVWIRLKMT